MGDNKKPFHHKRRLLSVLVVANMFGLSPRTVYNQISQGLFPIEHKKLGGSIWFDSRNLDQYLSRLARRRSFLVGDETYDH
jgi:predicted DNA-binding transcriptional regulator AlpA